MDILKEFAQRRQIALVATHLCVPPKTKFVFGIRFSFKLTEGLELQKQQCTRSFVGKANLRLFAAGPVNRNQTLGMLQTVCNYIVN